MHRLGPDRLPYRFMQCRAHRFLLVRFDLRLFCLSSMLADPSPLVSLIKAYSVRYSSIRAWLYLSKCARRRDFVIIVNGLQFIDK